METNLNAMLQTVEFPAGIAYLTSGLAEMKTDYFPLKKAWTDK